MNAIRTLMQVTRTNLKQRIRGRGFLVLLGATLLVTTFFVPQSDAGYLVLGFHRFRAAYNSAWVGTSLALMCTLLFSLLGFYLVRGSLDHDRRSGISRILDASALPDYLLMAGKALANTVTLIMLTGLIAAVGVILQLLRGEGATFDLASYIAPFIWITIPVLMVVGSIGVLFDVIPRLRGALGNAAYFIIWGVTSATARQMVGQNPAPNLFGTDLVMSSLGSACVSAFADCQAHIPKLLSGIEEIPAGLVIQVFPWDGIAWDLSMIAGRLAWLLLALGLMGLATIVYARKEYGVPRSAPMPDAADDEDVASKASAPAPQRLPRLAPDGLRFPIGGMFWAELNLLWREMGLKLGLLGLALVGVGLVSAPTASNTWLMALAWLWPVASWSWLGCREAYYGTQALLFASPSMLWRPVLAQWLAGAVLALLAASGVGIRMALAGDWGGVIFWVTGSLFIPALALCLGAWSGGRRWFEVTYLLMWYLGPIEGVPWLDFAGMHQREWVWLYVAAAAAFVGLAALRRTQQVRA